MGSFGRLAAEGPLGRPLPELDEPVLVSAPRRPATPAPIPPGPPPFDLPATPISVSTCAHAPRPANAAPAAAAPAARKLLRLNPRSFPIPVPLPHDPRLRLYATPSVPSPADIRAPSPSSLPHRRQSCRRPADRA